MSELSANLIWVENDQENGLSPPGFGSFGAPSPASISSNRCTLYPSLSSAVATDIDTVELTFAISFNAAFTGPMQDHMYIADNLGLDHWDSQADGTWTWLVNGTQAGPVISSLSTSFALVGTCISTSILGSGLSGSPQITSSDPNLTFAITSVSDSQLAVTLCVNSTDSDGDTMIFVTSFGQQSGGSRLTKQIPGSLSVVSTRLLSDAESAAAGCPNTFYGVFVSTKYQVNDKAGKNIAVAGLIPVERVTQYISNGIYGGNPVPNFANFTGNVGTDQAGTFLDHPFGECANFPFIASDIQELAVQIGASRYIIRTNNWQYRSSSPNSGSLTNGVDITLQK